MLQPGSLIGRYEIQRRLGRGGMGTVYVAHDPVLGRMVAIKVFLSDLDVADAAQRFAREARSAAALNHANIVTIHDFGEVSSQPFIVMEYIQGETLYEVIRKKAPVPAADKLRWMEELCAGVAYAHQVGVVHRDIKPTNLMIDRSGRLKILDFGIAKMLGTLATNATALIGTPGYMAPEQILGKSIDQRSDLFSIGVVGYELFSYTDAFAFPGDTVPTITHRILTAEPTPLTQVVPDINPELVAVVERSIKKSADDRFPDAEAMRTALNGVRRQIEGAPGWDTVAAGPPSPGGGGNRRGTGSARQPLNDQVGVAELTPPPDPRGTDREAALARRRATQIQAALELGQTLFDKGDLEAALDACEQALTLDGSHAEAMQLESRIRAALSKVRAGTLLDEARGELQKGALTAAQDLLQQARALDPEAAEARRVERDLRLARVEQERLRQRAEKLAAARQALEQRNVEAALALARDVLALDPDSADARSIEAEAMRRLIEDTGGSGISYERPPMPMTMPSPARAAADVAVAPAPALDKTIVAPARRTPPPPPAPPAAPAPAAKKRAAPPKAPVDRPKRDPFAPVRALVASAKGAVGATTTRQKQVVAAGAATVLLVVLAVVYLITPGAPVPRGRVVVDAVPWATITAIQTEDGTSQALPAVAATPLVLELDAGTYTLTLAGPPPGSETRQVTVQVLEGAMASIPVERFATLTPEEYFEQYVAARSAPLEQAAPEEDSASPPADPLPAGQAPPDPAQADAPGARPPGASE